MATPAAAPTKVFNNPRLLLTLKRASLFSSLLTLAEAFAMMGKESLICDDDREGKRRVRPFNSLPNDVGFRRVVIPVAIAMVYTYLYRFSKPLQNSSLVGDPAPGSSKQFLLEESPKMRVLPKSSPANLTAIQQETRSHVSAIFHIQ
jgi:hypothetical protein